MISNQLLVLKVRLGRFEIQLRLVVNKSAVEFWKGAQVSNNLVGSKAGLFSKLLMFSPQNNLDFDGFTRSHKNKHEQRLAKSKGNKQKKNSLAWARTRSILHMVGLQSGVGSMMSRNVSRKRQQLLFSSVLKWIEFFFSFSFFFSIERFFNVKAACLCHFHLIPRITYSGKCVFLMYYSWLFWPLR